MPCLSRSASDRSNNGAQRGGVPFDLVRDADDGGLGAGRVRHQGVLHLRGAEPVSRHVDDICGGGRSNNEYADEKKTGTIDTADDPVVAVLVALTTVSGQVIARECLHV